MLAHFRVPEGVYVGLNAWGVQLNKAVYGDDANTYRPERWLTDDTDRLHVMHQTHSLIFSYGPTKCLGMSMAMMEIPKVIFEVCVFPACIVNEVDWAGARQGNLLIQRSLLSF